MTPEPITAAFLILRVISPPNEKDLNAIGLATGPMADGVVLRFPSPKKMNEYSFIYQGIFRVSRENTPFSQKAAPFQ
jgi:hypothetical protein